ncbi:hypothetical protein EYF80_049374 [Liparis tanakae]|uniref:Uncharacterized protein n=1 Tax=Liparis tanakae TaxID=230148 RepID=A0A4Z2FJJ0_9TELE|nr:hypothetical protein EYF80_049374 [Liparis tanakae]
MPSSREEHLDWVDVSTAAVAPKTTPTQRAARDWKSVNRALFHSPGQKDQETQEALELGVQESGRGRLNTHLLGVRRTNTHQLVWNCPPFLPPPPLF